MRKLTTMVVALLVTLGTLTGLSRLQADSPEPTIKKVMKVAMKKGGLCGKVAQGQASDSEKEELLKLFKDMQKASPPKGDADSWKTKTSALVVAAEAAVEGKATSAGLLKKAANCKSCHDEHKGN